MMQLPGDETWENKSRIYDIILAIKLFDLVLIFPYFSIH